MNLNNFADMSTVARLFGAAARTATANGTGVDIQQYDGEIAFILESAAGTGTTPTLDVKIQDSADNSTFADVTGLTFTQVTDGGAALEKIGGQKTALRRYVRAVATIAGTTPSFTFNVVLAGVKKYPA